MKRISLYAVMLMLSWVTCSLAQEGFGEIGAGSGGDSKMVITINSAGSSQIRSETTVSRGQAETQARVFKLMRERAASESELDNSAAPQAEPALDTKPMTDDDLARELRGGGTDSEMNSDDESGSHIEVVDISSNSVHTIRTQAFDSLAQLLAGVPRAGIAGGFITSLRMEKNVDGNLRLTFSSSPDARRYLAVALDAWKTQGSKLEFKMALPGRVISSDLPNTNGNTTWIAADATNEMDFQAYKKFLQKPAVITAELGGLKIDQPIDSNGAWRLEQAEKTAGIPISDAGPGFAAEAQVLSVATVYNFPGQTNGGGDTDAWSRPVSPPGLTIRAKLSAPPEREIKSVSDVETLGGTDDKGRPVKASANSAEEEPAELNSAAADSTTHDSCTVQLQLSLPEPDARSIQELSGQAVVDTVGKWTEMTITNVEGIVSNAIDLSPMLPGAKLIVTKVTKRMQKINIKAELVGPPEIRQIDVKYGSGGEPNSSVSEGTFTAKASESAREIRIQAWNISNDPNQSGDTSTLTVRYPQDERRERVKFKLTGLDLF